MDLRKPVYLLAGGRSRSRRMPDPLIEAVFKGSGTPSPKVCYVGTANGDDEGFFSRMADIFKEMGAVRVDHALIASGRADLKKAQDILKSADIIFISGGDVERGVRTLEEKKMTHFLSQLYREGKSFFGLSAGSIMLAKEWIHWRNPDDDTTAEIFPCLGLAPIICDTHDEEYGWEELRALLQLEQDRVKGYGIPAGMAIKVFPDGRVEALGGAVHQYLRQGGRVERVADILPEGDR